jgi:hypothetical protein
VAATIATALFGKALLFLARQTNAQSLGNFFARHPLLNECNRLVSTVDEEMGIPGLVDDSGSSFRSNAA